MLPISSSTADQGCSPVSSNCVIWQGPDLSCINLCKGDTVSDVVYKVATQLCTLQTELDLSDLDLSCLVSFCSSANPAPTTQTLAAVLEFIIAKVCCLNTRCTVLEGASPGNSYTEPTLTLPSCLQYTNAQGQTVTQLVHNQYTLTLGTNSAISIAAGKQCAQMGTLPALSQTGTMSAISGWKSNVTTLSDSIFNLWVTVCDMRGAIAALKDCCGTLDCSSVIIDFVLTANNNRDTLTLNFAGLTNIPVTLSECSQAGSKVTVTDASGKSYTTFIQVVSNKNGSVNVNLSGSGLNTALNYTVKLEPCVKNAEGKTCEKVITKTNYAACTNITITSATIS